MNVQLVGTSVCKYFPPVLGIYSFFLLEVEWNIVMNMVMKRDMLFETDCSYFAMIGFLD